MGGGETSLLNQLIALRQHPEIVTVLFCPEGDLAKHARTVGIDTRIVTLLPFGYTTLRGLLAFLGNGLKVSWVVKRHRVTILHVESASACYCSLLAGFSRCASLYVTYHGFWRRDRRLVSLLVSKVVRKVFVVSKHLIDEAADVFGAAKVQHLDLSLSPGFCETETAPPSHTRRRLGLPENGQLILQVARYQEIKGQERLLMAFETGRLRGAFTNTALVFAGDVMAGSEDAAHAYYRKVREHAERSPCRSDIYFLPFQTKVQNLMMAADVIVVPSEYESFGMVVIETMALGRPVIATNRGGPAEIITDGQDGFLFSPNDIETLISAMRRILEFPEVAARLAACAAQTARARYLPAVRTQILLDNYRKTV